MDKNLYLKLQNQMLSEHNKLLTPLSEIIKDGMTVREFIEVNPRQDTVFMLKNGKPVEIYDIEMYLDNEVTTPNEKIQKLLGRMDNVVFIELPVFRFAVRGLWFTRDCHDLNHATFDTNTEFVDKVGDRYFLESKWEIYPDKEFNGNVHVSSLSCANDGTAMIYALTKDLDVPDELKSMFPIVEPKYGFDDSLLHWQQSLIKLDESIVKLLNKCDKSDFWKNVTLEQIEDYQEVPM